jgi:hypothetical protein
VRCIPKNHHLATMSVESEYKLENVAATSVPSDQIDATFKSSTIGEWISFILSG